MDDVVSIDTIIKLIKFMGGDAHLAGDLLHVYPKHGKAVVYEIPPRGLGRRLIIEIGQRTGVHAHWFWHPERAAKPPKK